VARGGTIRNRLEGPWLDAALHLLDRQVLDSNGEMVCNVDDLEVSEDADGTLAVTGILVGPAALWPRLSGVLGDWLRRMWLNLGVQYADRDVPMYLPLDVVDMVDSAVHLKVARDGLLDRQPHPTEGEERHRLGELLGMKVRTADGDGLGEVIDVRLEPRSMTRNPRLLLTALVVGHGRPGSLLGYDRGDFTGPWLVRRVVRWLHRHTGTLGVDRIERIDWEDAHLAASGPLEPLGDR
jgi:sporulation protein YlmC with PRC-barrel domain